MLFDSFNEAQWLLLWSAFLLAFIMGVVVNKTNFCTMGAVSDMVNMGDYSRFRSWLLAIAVALAGVVVLESAGLMSVDGSFPPYRDNQIIWLENILGGLMFGIGMTLGSGCGNKTLIRIGGGNVKSILVFLVIGLVAFYMNNPFPGTDKTLYSELFYSWVSPTAISLDNSSDLGSLINADNAVQIRLIAGLLICVMLLVYIFRSAEFRQTSDNILSGLVIGVAVLGAWYISANINIQADGDVYSLAGYYEEWDMLAESDEGKPSVGRPLSTQSFTFINPIAQSYGYIASGFKSMHLTFGLFAVAGVILGSLFWSLVSRSFRIEWFASKADLFTHLIGAVLMGLGGTLALGCTIGQAITGISTLAVGSILTMLAILFASALTMKTQYYKMLYEDASLFAAVITGLVELRLLPASMRKLDAV
jgi:uncharacterized protein